MVAHWRHSARDFDRKMSLAEELRPGRAAKKEAPPWEGLRVLLHGGETADSESSLFAVARHVLSRNGALDGDGETLRGCSRIGCRRASPVNVARQSVRGRQRERLYKRSERQYVGGSYLRDLALIVSDRDDP